MKQIFLITAINPDNNNVISVWTKQSSMILAIESSYQLLRDEYKILGYLDTILSATLMNSNAK